MSKYIYAVIRQIAYIHSLQPYEIGAPMIHFRVYRTDFINVSTIKESKSKLIITK